MWLLSVVTGIPAIVTFDQRVIARPAGRSAVTAVEIVARGNGRVGVRAAHGLRVRCAALRAGFGERIRVAARLVAASVARVGVVFVRAGISSACRRRYIVVVVARAGDRFIGSVDRGTGLYGSVLAADGIASDRDAGAVAGRGHDIEVARRVAAGLRHRLGACAGLRGGVISADRVADFIASILRYLLIADRETVIALATGLRGDA